MNVSIHEMPSVLANAIGKASKRVKSVSYEYPGFWVINTALDSYDLGDISEEIGWNNEDGEGGYLPDSDKYTSPLKIAEAFATWLESVEGN